VTGVGLTSEKAESERTRRALYLWGWSLCPYPQSPSQGALRESFVTSDSTSPSRTVNICYFGWELWRPRSGCYFRDLVQTDSRQSDILCCPERCHCYRLLLGQK
jgi:hypothetical protein